MLLDLGYEQVLKAVDATQAYRAAKDHQPSIIVLDLGLPGVGGLNMIEPLMRQAPEARILIFSMNEQTVFVARSLEAGARGYLSKNSSLEAFNEAISTLERDEVFLERQVAISVASMRFGDKADPLETLTRREHQVLKLLGNGQSLQAIADALNVSYKTAANTSTLLKKKLGVRNTAEVVRVAIEHKLN